MRVHKSFYQYVIPSMLAFALSGIYSIADGFFVGNALGDNALAAINIAYPFTAFLQAVGTGIGMGGAIKYSIHTGRGDTNRSQKYFGMSLLLLGIVGVLLTLLFLWGASVLFSLFGASGDIFTLGKEYLLFISFGAVFQVLGTGLVPFIRNMGGSVMAMVAMIVGFLTNILLDYLFVWVFPWGMMGAAIATVIGQTMTFLVCLLFFILNKKMPSFSFGHEKWSLAKKIFCVGLSPFGLTFSPNITLILVNKSASLVGGTMAVTCYAPISYISSVIMLLIQGVSDGSQPIISLSYGEGNLDQTKAIRRLAFYFASGVAVVCMIALFLLRGNAAALFGASEQISTEVARILPIFLSGYFFVGISRVTTAYFYATGKNLWAYLLIYGEPIALFLLLLFMPSMIGGIGGTWISIPISQLIAMLLSIYFVIYAPKMSERRK